MDSFPTCTLRYTRNIKYNHELSNTYLAVKNQNYCQQCEKN